MTIKERIISFLEENKLKKKDFYEETGIAASNFKGVGMNSGLGSDKIVKILSLYPKLDANWLFTGEGSMIRGEEKEPIAPKVEVIEHPINVEMIGMLNEKSKEIGRLEAKVEMIENRIKELEAKLTASHTLPVAAEPHQGYEGKVNVSVIGLRAPVGGGTKKR